MRRKHLFAKCRECGEHLYEGDTAYIIDGNCLCPACVKAHEVTLPEPDITPAPDYVLLRSRWKTTRVTDLSQF